MAWKWHVTIPGMRVRPPRSTTRSSGPLATGSAPLTDVIRSSSTTTVIPGAGPFSPSSTVAPPNTTRPTSGPLLPDGPHRIGPVPVGGGRPDGVEEAAELDRLDDLRARSPRVSRCRSRRTAASRSAPSPRSTAPSPGPRSRPGRRRSRPRTGATWCSPGPVGGQEVPVRGRLVVEGLDELDLQGSREAEGDGDPRPRRSAPVGQRPPRAATGKEVEGPHPEPRRSTAAMAASMSSTT